MFKTKSVYIPRYFYNQSISHFFLVLSLCS